MGNGASQQSGEAGRRAEAGPIHPLPPTNTQTVPQAEQTVQVIVGGGDNDEGNSPLGSGSKEQSDPADARFLEDELPAKYLRRELIGKGAFGEAYLVERTSDNKRFVGKVMELHSMSPQDKKYAHTEILCLAHSMHFAVIQYVEHLVVDEDTVVIIMEYADGGDLYNNIRKKKAAYTEKEAGMYFVQLLLALDHIHRRRMIHRDIKSANVLMTRSGLIKLGDFGFSQQYDQTVSGGCAQTFLGTPYYLAPEMWQGMRYGKMADVWAATIVLFEFLTGGRPFVASSMPQLKELVLRGTYTMPETLSRDMKEFVHFALTHNPQQRPSAQDLLRTPLMQHYIAVLEQHVAGSTLIDAPTKALVSSNIRESMQAIRDTIASGVPLLMPTPYDPNAANIVPSSSPPAAGGGLSKRIIRYESTVYKESESGQWKERYLMLDNDFITLTLAKGKDAANGGDRSKRIPTESIVSAVPVSQPQLTAAGGGPNTAKARYAFAISTRSSPAIVFATYNESERDEWVEKILELLEMA